jgi:predicted transcriptional regulator
MSTRNIAEESARARKILAKNGPLQLSSSSKKNVTTNTSDTSVGEFGSILVCGPGGTDQYTICRPIGYTDLDDKSWTIIKTDEVQQALLRLRDPNSEELNRNRANFRTAKLVEAGLIKKLDVNGRKVSYYVGYEEASRASVLEQARKAQKAHKNALLVELNQLPKKGSGERRSQINDALQKTKKIGDYIPENLRNLEKLVQDALNHPEMERQVMEAYPTTYRTLVGPYGNMPQQPIHGARGMPLVDVMSSLSNCVRTMGVATPHHFNSDAAPFVSQTSGFMTPSQGMSATGTPSLSPTSTGVKTPKPPKKKNK